MFPEMIVIKYRIHEITIDVNNYVAHPSDSVTIGDSVRMTVQNVSGTFTYDVGSNNANSTHTNGLGTSDSVMMTVQNASGTYTFNGN
jgi:ribosomal 50S subunit-recycling heat shock protein